MRAPRREGGRGGWGGARGQRGHLDGVDVHEGAWCRAQCVGRLVLPRRHGGARGRRRMEGPLVARCEAEGRGTIKISTRRSRCMSLTPSVIGQIWALCDLGVVCVHRAFA